MKTNIVRKLFTFHNSECVLLRGNPWNYPKNRGNIFAKCNTPYHGNRAHNPQVNCRHNNSQQHQQRDEERSVWDLISRGTFISRFCSRVVSIIQFFSWIKKNSSEIDSTSAHFSYVNWNSRSPPVNSALVSRYNESKSRLKYYRVLLNVLLCF